VKYHAIQTTVSSLSFARRCALLGVSRSGYYAWCTRPLSARVLVNQAIVAAMQQIHREVDRTYGSPRMCRELCARGLACGRHRVARQMASHGIRAKQARRYRVTTESVHSLPVAPNRLQQQFTVPAPNRVWMADLTYVRTQEGWSYLAVILDAFGRRVVGWAVGRDLATDLPRRALEMALALRRPEPGLIHHSDRGVQYASHEYQAVLAAHAITPSMSRRGNCWDNAVVESFFRTLKVERLHDRRYVTRDEAYQDIADYIERWYNRLRRHSTLGHLSPVMYELRHAA
jgi:putative transposase